MFRMRAILIACCMCLPMAAVCAQPTVSSGAHRGVQGQWQKTQAQLQRQRAQSAKLKARVGELENRSKQAHGQLDRRDREIAELQRKLEAEQAGKAAAATAAATASSGG